MDLDQLPKFRWTNGLHPSKLQSLSFYSLSPAANKFVWSKEQGKDGQHAIGASYLKASNHMLFFEYLQCFRKIQFVYEAPPIIHQFKNKKKTV